MAHASTWQDHDDAFDAFNMVTRTITIHDVIRMAITYTKQVFHKHKTPSIAIEMRTDLTFNIYCACKLIRLTALPSDTTIEPVV